jgi:hypothetical protein
MPISFWGLDLGKSLVKRYWPDDAFQKQQLLNSITLGLGAMSFCKQSLVQAQGLHEASLPIIVVSGGIGGSLSWLFDDSI